MTRIGLLATTLLLTLLPILTAAPPADAATRTRRLDGVEVSLRPGTRQVVTVNRTRGYHARVTYWVKNRDGWQVRMRATDGRIGYGGLVPGRERRQGTGTTPLGTYRLPWAFGRHAAKDVWKIDYRRIHRGDFWVQDNASDFYNRYRNQEQGGFRWRLPASDANSSERLTDYPRQYEWSIVTSFNHRQVRHRGAGIFLHVNGSGATGGCVSAPRPFIRRLMARLDPARVPVIAIGR
ncbi:L,D-peptidoglycan transpeptidase YkuD (ErfK/YbiS/YcfS/YnhG family) [Nocardioides ginsengisegetis]|uniref:L,D-peptidoglycan transpeptidase YkuD (ErfK/YbiS/YcfS/YnhG family) n=1 Tax=Nocardioides ginsengisegetis TaxID=661491 RepID=A0A7W3PA68_9ACTN|nr:L,D-transpeptidase family protein [Nocardioides ginsengisegetis]MBA8804435.1 L,D-peptidoglycan transpeptidase YkuD (ErfK/YbiS/YcfS/YnhG family) [Nocardioides ginsengisegetis]